MRNIFKNIPIPLKHIFFWFVPYLTLLGLEASEPYDPNYDWFTEVTFSFAVAAAIVYINLYLCKKYFLNQKQKYFSGAVLLYSLYLLVLYFTVYPGEKETITGRPSTLYAFFFFYTLYFLLIFLLSFVFWLATTANKKNKELLAAQLLLQKFKTDKSEAENKFLQSQINPHFLYNTLNFFYSKALTLSPELAESILLLSDTMRYSLELKENDKGMALLKKEVNHIYNLIKINQYRFNHKLQIRFLITGSMEAICIAPLVLITFVENAFKHADLFDIKSPLIITLSILKEEQIIKFSVENKTKKGPKELGTGIGIENAKRRLEYLYEHQYQLTINQGEDYYSALLTLPLFKDFAL